MDPVRHIVCAVDFSAPSERALSAAVDLAETLDAKLTVLHAFRLIDVWLPDVAIPDKETLDAETRVAVEEKLNALVEKYGREGVRIQHAAVEGDPRTAVIEGTQWREADLIVVGTHGYTGFKHAMLGSTAEAIVRRSPIPVLTIHATESAA